MMGKLAARSLRHRTGGFLATFLALFIGATFVMACGGLMETGIRNNVPPQRLAGAPLLVTGDRTYSVPTSKKHKKQLTLPERVELPATAVEKVRAVPGVRTAVGERTFDAAVRGEKAEAHGWESAALTPYALASGTAPTPGEVVLDAATARRAGVTTGDRVEITAHGGTAAYRVSGVATARNDVPRHTLFFAQDDAVRLSGRPDSVADIAVTLAPGADLDAVRKGVREALDGQSPVTLLTGDDRGAVEHPEVTQGSGDLIALSGVVGGLVIAVAVFVVAGTVALSAQQRSRELALLRAIGTSSRQLRRMLLGETLLVMLLAAAAAWFAGPVAGRWLFGTLVDTGMIAETVEFRQGWIPAMPAYGALLLTAVGGTLLGSVRAVRAKPVEALGEAAVQKPGLHPARIVLGLLFLAGTTALALVSALVLRGPVAASTAGPTVMCCAIAFALLGPWVTKAVTALLYWPVRLLTGASGRLAALNCRARTARTAAVAMPVMLAAAIATGELYLQTTAVAATDAAFASSLRADAVVSTDAGVVTPDLLDRVRALPGVTAASAYVTSSGWTEPRDGDESKKGLPLQGVSADGVDRTLAVDVREGSLGALRGAAIALPTGKAHRIHKAVGDTVRMRLGDGTRVDLRVVALFEGREGYDTAYMSSELLAPHTTAGLPSQILVRGSLHPDQLGAGVRVSSRDAVTAAHAHDNRTQASVNYLIAGMLIAYTVLSVVNTTVVAVSDRRKEFALQRLTGATRAQVLRMMTVEGVLVTAVGLLLGTLAAGATLVPFSLAAAGTWWPSGPVSIYATVVAGAVGVVLLATLIPAWRVLRVRPVEAARG